MIFIIHWPRDYTSWNVREEHFVTLNTKGNFKLLFLSKMLFTDFVLKKQINLSITRTNVILKRWTKDKIDKWRSKWSGLKLIHFKLTLFLVGELKCFTFQFTGKKSSSCVDIKLHFKGTNGIAPLMMQEEERERIMLTCLSFVREISR